MAVLGFLVTRRMCRSAGLDPEVIANAALYCLVIGMIGARTFFVVHYFDQFRGDLAGVFAVWRGGLEFLGGVIPAIATGDSGVPALRSPWRSSSTASRGLCSNPSGTTIHSSLRP